MYWDGLAGISPAALVCHRGTRLDSRSESDAAILEVLYQDLVRQELVVDTPPRRRTEWGDRAFPGLGQRAPVRAGCSGHDGVWASDVTRLDLIAAVVDVDLDVAAGIESLWFAVGR